MEQTSLLKPLIVKTWPQRTNSKDFSLMGRGEDGRIYALKRVSDRDTLPLTEWLCYRLATTAKIAVPFFQVMYTHEDEPVFASRWEGGNLEFVPSILKKVSDPGRLSAIYALDLFLHNHDRHIGNFLFCDAADDNVVVVAFDFSRCFIYHSFPLPDVPLHRDCETRLTRRAIEKVVPFNLAAAMDSLQLIESVTDDTIGSWIDQVPGQWVGTPVRSAMLGWWKGEQKSRVALIREGLTNGTFV